MDQYILYYFIPFQGVGRNKSTYTTFLADQDSGSGGDYYSTYWVQPTFVSSRKYFAHFTSSTNGQLDFRNDGFHEVEIWNAPGIVLREHMKKLLLTRICMIQVSYSSRARYGHKEDDVVGKRYTHQHTHRMEIYYFPINNILSRQLPPLQVFQVTFDRKVALPHLTLYNLFTRWVYLF